MIKGQNEIAPIDSNLSNDNRTTLIKIIKVSFSHQISIHQSHLF